MNLREKALEILDDSLYPVATELNELDWKSGLSCKTDRLAQHLCAFSNLKGGGLLVYGVNNDATLFSITKEVSDEIIQKLGNIAKNNLSISIAIEHWTIKYKGYDLLFIHIPEQIDKPIHLRGKEIWDSYTRSAGQTVKMSRSQIKSLIADSQGITFEQRIAKENVNTDELLALLDYAKYFEMSGKEMPKDKQIIAKRLEEFGLCIQNEKDWHITNMGAILFARDIEKFENLKTHSVIVRKYAGSNNRTQISEQIGKLGYLVGFEGLIEYIMKLSSVEEIGVVRKMIPSYPKIAIREFVANALIHQDFAIEGMQVVVEIYDNRIAITNPGAPLHDVNRLLDLPPQSRNERLAQAMFLLGICERRGSGIDRAVEAIESMLLPAAKITKGENHTRVFLFVKKELSEMTKQEKIDACYQHACLVYEDNKAINNQSIRERFGIDKNHSSVASRIIADTLEANKIKISDENIVSKKYATYFPYYA